MTDESTMVKIFKEKHPEFFEEHKDKLFEFGSIVCIQVFKDLEKKFDEMTDIQRNVDEMQRYFDGYEDVDPEDVETYGGVL